MRLTAKSNPRPVRPNLNLNRSKPGLDLWTLLVGAIALLIAAPVLVVLGSLLTPAWDVWQHLASTVLARYVLNSLALLLGVGAGVVLLGTGTAWLVTMTQFPGRSLLSWALLLPLAFPAYLLAYAYTELLDYYGPVQTGLRSLLGFQSAQDYWFPPIRSLPGAIALLALVLYPYVYLLARVAFGEQSVCSMEASRSLGCNPWQSFGRVALPLARPAIAAGTALALMETLGDFGTVQYFGVDTFTTGIYRTWFGMGERAAASQLAALLMLFVLALILLEQWFRRQGKYYQQRGKAQSQSRFRLAGWRSGLAIAACTFPILLGFAIPAGLLLHMTLRNLGQLTDPRLWGYARNSFLAAALTAGLAGAIALLLAYGVRLRPTRLMHLSLRTSALGYAIPGSVIAVGVLVPLGLFDNSVDAWMQRTFGISTGLLLSGTIAALVFAYLVRFLAVALNSVESGLGRIKPSLDNAARSLGENSLGVLRRVHAPLMGSSLLSATLLVFVDVMKELPATLIVRPFNFDTLAVRVYQLASDERLAESSAAALAIVAVGIVPVVLLSQQIAQSNRD
ncbi:MAG: iron ABC transporter permease [Cyanobacteria bacterium J069]|nr:MAG: iron ABC transporter permease [Cyanobacteria bacterium J069]